MKKFITMVLLLGFLSPALTFAADGTGEQSDSEVDCTKIFEGTGQPATDDSGEGSKKKSTDIQG